MAGRDPAAAGAAAADAAAVSALPQIPPPRPPSALQKLAERAFSAPLRVIEDALRERQQRAAVAAGSGGLAGPPLRPLFRSRPPRSILMYGVPGTGKTSLIRSLARQFEGKLAFFMPTSADLNTAWKDSESAQLEAFYQVAASVTQFTAATFAVLFFDEFDSIGARGGANQPELLRMLMSGSKDEEYANVITMGASNDPDRLDAGIISRFGANLVHIDKPGLAERLYVIRSVVRQYNAAAGDLFSHLRPPSWLLRTLAQCTGMSLRGYMLLDAAGLVTPDPDKVRDDILGIEETILQLAADPTNPPNRQANEQTLRVIRTRFRLDPKISPLAQAATGKAKTAALPGGPSGGPERRVVQYTVDGILTEADERERRTRIWGTDQDTGWGIAVGSLLLPTAMDDTTPMNALDRALRLQYYGEALRPREGQRVRDAFLAWSADDMGRTTRTIVDGIQAMFTEMADVSNAEWHAWVTAGGPVSGQRPPADLRDPKQWHPRLINGVLTHGPLMAGLSQFARLLDLTTDDEYMTTVYKSLQGRLEEVPPERANAMAHLLANKERYAEDRFLGMAVNAQRAAFWHRPSLELHRAHDDVPLWQFLMGRLSEQALIGDEEEPEPDEEDDEAAPPPPDRMAVA